MVDKPSASVQLAETPTAIVNSFRYRTHHDSVTEAVTPCLGVKNPLAAATQNLGHLSPSSINPIMWSTMHKLRPSMV